MSSQAMLAVAQLGVQLYQGCLRKQAARECIFKEFLRAFPGATQPTDVLSTAATPFVLTPRFRNAWKLIVTATKNSASLEPILIVGPDGCGKSACVGALAAVLQQHVDSCYLTAETDPAELVGQQLPSDSRLQDSPTIAWVDGNATRAYRAGNWLLLDNLAPAEASVLERLNPLLEQPPVWVLTEKGEVQALAAKQGADGQLSSGPAAGYQLFATMTPSTNNKGPELSPALFNRFTIVNMPNVSQEEAEFKKEIAIIADRLLGDVPPVHQSIMVDVCWVLFQKQRDIPSLTFRSLVRLIDSTYKLQQKHPFISALWTALQSTCFGQLDSTVAGSVVQAVQRVFGNEPSSQDAMATVKYFDPAQGTSLGSAHILTASRLKHAEALMACIDCNLPVLLEVCFASACAHYHTSIATF